MASNKISDIIAPKKPREVVIPPSPQKEPPLRPKLVATAKKAVVTAARPAPAAAASPKKAFWWPVAIILGLVVVGGAAYVLIKPKAEIDIWPVKNPVEFKTQIMVTGSQDQEAFIPGEVRTQENSLSQQFPATGVELKAAKASGKITVYNAYALSSQVLIANTRFVSDDGKLFRTPSKVIIPGAHYEGSKLIPGEIEITVEAGEPGEAYNIGPSTFSIPGLAGTPRYTAFYAKSFKAMSGGTKSEAKKVTAEDLKNAEEVLTTRAIENCKAALVNAVSLNDYVVVNEAIKTTVTEAVSSAKEGQNVENFTFQVRAKAETLIFKRSDVSVFAKEYVLSHLPDGQKLDENSLAVSFLSQEVDLDKEKIFLNVEISAQIYPSVDEDRIKEAVKNQTPSQMSSSLKGFSEITKSQVRLWPFWANRGPLETAGISIKIRLD